MLIAVLVVGRHEVCLNPSVVAVDSKGNLLFLGEDGHRPTVVGDGWTGVRGLAGFLPVLATGDAGFDILGGLVTRENGVLAAETRVLSHVVVDRRRVVALGLGVTPLPRLVYGNLASPFPRLNGISEE